MSPENRRLEMEKLIFANANNRELNFKDKIFSVAAKYDEAVKAGNKDAVNATIGALIDDSGKLVVFQSVVDCLKNLAPEDYARYAPISGIPAYIEVAQKLAFGSHKPDMYTAACYTPGGTGALRLFVSNYTKIRDSVITSDWYWANYKSICTELQRSLTTYPLVDKDGKYNVAGLEAKVDELLKTQDTLGIIINTPAHNPTGFSLTGEDWDKVLEMIRRKAPAESGKKVTILVDAAYIDYTGDPDAERAFVKKFEKNPDNILCLMAYSASKAFTMYGMRCGALVCMTNNKDICVEFENVARFSSRATWSNGVRAAQTVVANMYNDPKLREKLEAEREASNKMLLRRGKVFEEAAKECGLVTVPFDAGFFIAIPCDDPDAVCELIFKRGLFPVPLAKGIRVALSAVNEEQCKWIPGVIKECMDEYYGK